jgi:hypothetical protein
MRWEPSVNPQSERPLDAPLALADALFGPDPGDEEQAPVALLAEQIKQGLDALSLELLNQWLEDGRGVCVYENAEIGHPECGHRQYLSTATFKKAPYNGVPPETLPDFPDRINFRYRLVGVYTGEQI